jgi:hypothetical protein
MKYLAFMFSIVFIVSCTHTAKIKQSDELPPPTLLGKWECNNVNIASVEDAELKSDISINGPFSDHTGLIEWISFYDNLLYIKMGNESKERDAIRYVYLPREKVILITDGMETDTFLRIDKLSFYELDFTHNTADTSGSYSNVQVYRYQSVRK